MTIAEFLDGVKANVSRINRYETRGDGTGGKSDCIG